MSYYVEDEPILTKKEWFKLFWMQDVSFKALFGMMVFTIFFLPVLIETGHAGLLLLNIMLLLIFFVGIWSAYTRVTMVLSAVFFSVHFLLRVVDSDGMLMLILEDVVTAFNILVFITINFQLLFRDNQFSFERVLGAVNVYLLIALLGAVLFNLVGLLFGSSLEGNVTLKSDAGDLSHFIYFSLVSLTTVGFGDIYPANHAARMLSVALSAVGILYPAVSTYEMKVEGE